MADKITNGLQADKARFPLVILSVISFCIPEVAESVISFFIAFQFKRFDATKEQHCCDRVRQSPSADVKYWARSRK